LRLLSIAVGFSVSLAMLAGCTSSTQETTGLPLSAGASQAFPRGVAQSMAGRKLSYLEFLKEQIEGKLLHYLPRTLLEIQYKGLREKGPLPEVQRDSKPIGIWVANQHYLNGNNALGYLLGATPKGRVVRVVPFTDGCLPSTLKVDHSQNVWVGCETMIDGMYEEYNSLGKHAATYNWLEPRLPCPPSYTYCYTLSAYGLDGAANASYVFGTVENTTTCYTNYGPSYTCNLISAAGFEWWPRNNPSAFGTFVSLYDCCGSEHIQTSATWISTVAGTFYLIIRGPTRLVVAPTHPVTAWVRSRIPRAPRGRSSI
jgi:hypothetical protein